MAFRDSTKLGNQFASASCSAVVPLRGQLVPSSADRWQEVPGRRATEKSVLHDVIPSSFGFVLDAMCEQGPSKADFIHYIGAVTVVRKWLWQSIC